MEVQELLDELREERNKLEPQNPRIKEIVDALVEIGEYPINTPAQLEYGYTPFRMVECWGVDWHKWREPHSCPCCNADLRDHVNGPPFKREIGQYDSGLDCSVAWMCPDCNERWTRTNSNHNHKEKFNLKQEIKNEGFCNEVLGPILCLVFVLLGISALCFLAVYVPWCVWGVVFDAS